MRVICQTEQMRNILWYTGNVESERAYAITNSHSTLVLVQFNKITFQTVDLILES